MNHCRILFQFLYFRWIVYTIQARKFHAKAEWSFTKIEEQQKLKENDVTEEEAIELQETPSPQHYESLAIPENKGIFLQFYIDSVMDICLAPYIWLLNKPYENEVNLTGQNPPLKCCQPLEFLTNFKMGLDCFLLKICGL